MSKTSDIVQLMIFFSKALLKVGNQYDTKQLESLAFDVFYAMNAVGRNFHNSSHVVDLLRATNTPEEVFAVLYHDTVYMGVDKNFPKPFRSFLSKIVKLDTDYNLLRLEYEENERFELVYAIFNTTNERFNLSNGLNELLSALVAANELSNFISKKQIFKVAVIINTTIPFLSTDLFEKKVFHFKNVAKVFDIDLSAREFDSLMQSAIKIANQDVINFAYSRTDLFLSRTWRLLQETTPAFKAQATHTVKEYREAIMRMHNFFTSLNINSIFHSHGNYPTMEQQRIQRNNASKNIDIAKSYLHYKLLSASLLECIADLSGGDIPISYFMGSLSTKDYWMAELFDNESEELLLLDKTPRTEVFDLLAYGRKNTEKFDTDNSPIGAYLYYSIPEDKLNQLSVQAKKYFHAEITASNYILFFPSQVVTKVISIIQEMAYTRKICLEEIKKEVNTNNL